MESGRGTVKNPVYAGVGAPWKKRLLGRFYDYEACLGEIHGVGQAAADPVSIGFLVILLGGIFMRNATIARIIVAVYAACIGVLMLPAIIGRWPAAFRGAVRNPEAVRKARISVYLHLAIGAFHCVGMLSALLLLFLP